MEFPFNINNVLQDEISVIDRNLTPFRLTYETVRQRKDELRKVIDEMGQKSAKAQSLNGPITSASRLAQSAHRLYVKKDSEANDGNGAVVGFLKVGPKKLFVYDSGGFQHEMAPLCVLDFFVCESCQRQGSGRQLFDAMLQRENISPGSLAIDRPSAKCLSFLARHYSLRHAIPQVNNFVVFQEFFQKRMDSGETRSFNRPKDSSFGNGSHFGAAGSNQILGQGRVECPGGGYPALRPPSGRPQSIIPSGAIDRPPSGKIYAQRSALGMAAHQVMYSRHQVASPLVMDIKSTAVQTLANTNGRAASPPLLQRDGPPADYIRFTGNCDYLGRRGHLRLGSVNESSPDTSNLCDASNVRTLRQRQQDTAFNIFGVPKLPLKTINSNSTPYRRTALW